MKLAFVLGAGLASLLTFVGCGDDDSATGGSGGGSTTTSTSTTGATSTSSSSTTASSSSTGQGGGSNLDASGGDGPEDCPGGEGGDINAGYHACQYPVDEATACTGSKLDECCDSSECEQGACFPAPLVPFCGGVQPEEYNACGSDLCATNDDCPGGVCIPAGVVGNQVAMCVPAQCFGTVCGQESLSSCALVRDPCCNGPAGFFCIDPETGCQTNEDCPDGHCAAGVCMAGPPICPG